MMEKNDLTYGDENGGYDAVVIGSGYGGSVAACRLAVAGIKVCLIEKGRRWEAQDFPTDSLKIISAFRVENCNSGAAFGPKNALFQVYEQDGCVAAVANGLGGGSLINAGVMVPTPVRARRNPKWPKEWERNWEVCQESVSSMLSIQTTSVKFPSTRVMEEICRSVDDMDETHESSNVKLSINFDVEDQSASRSSSHPVRMGSCMACGNCLSGCPYNAKGSTDKNYLASAIQAGCIVKTNCQVKYVVENPVDICQEQTASNKGRQRWLVFIDETDYIACDFVLFSGGVLGTTDILFQSQLRGLKVSERLGSGFSCNGNNVAYLAGSPAPLNAYGLDKNQFSKIPFHERPGPSISSSYTSSLGFTIQKAVLPTAYPFLLFKGIITYGWPTGFWFLHGIIDKMKHALGFKSSQAMILCAMGYDNSDGKITFDKETNKLRFYPPDDLLLPRKVEAFQKLTRKLGGILFMARFRSTSVHLLGGCIASSNASHGVCNPNGQVFDLKTAHSVHPGLYVCDASLIPCSVGINPSLTIATVAEHVSKHAVQNVLGYIHELAFQGNNNVDKLKNIITPSPPIVIKETLIGYISGMPCMAHLIMKMNVQNKNVVFAEQNQFTTGDSQSHPLLRGKVSGHVVFKAVEQDKLHVILGEVDLCQVNNRTPHTQFMHYRLLLAAPSGSRYILEGKKILNPYLFGLFAWGETTNLHVTFKKIVKKGSSDETVDLKGELKISMMGLVKSLISMKGSNRGRFVRLFLQSLLRTYIFQDARGNYKDMINPSPIQQIPYPSSILHEIKTVDGFTISCKHWERNYQNLGMVEGEKKKKPVLLLNGHSNESYCLPTEPNDLVRTLLKEGHEIWLLQPRLHPFNCSNNFTIDDIGKYDIPAVMQKIQELHGTNTKVHVMAHCIGGLSIHIAIMGGHVSSTNIASLTCTNSSMFFKVTTSSKVKMWLPLIPISMVILGKKTILPLFTTTKASFRHRLLKAIARIIPRCERCPCDECEVLSGFFGNAFWHENITPRLHYWLSKESLPILPLSAFPHIRKICRAGFIVDSNGNNSYLIHPERMALPTKYISGGRTLLATPQTSFLANNYMKLHQPCFRHDRVVIDGFGHSDLLIGEESSHKVFPHILSHIRSAETQEQGKGSSLTTSSYSKQALEWGRDYLYNNHDPIFGNGGTLFSGLVTVGLLVLFFRISFSLVSLLRILDG